MAEKETQEVNSNIDEASAADTLKPGAGSGGGDTKAQTLATFTSLLAQLGKDDLSKIFNDVQSQFGPNKAPGAEDKAASNRATVAMKPSDAVGKGAWKEDIDDMFGDDLTEDFKERAEVVFEAALNTRMNLEVARLEEEFAAKEDELEEAYEAVLEEQTAAVMEEVTAKLDQYLDYCVEQWMEDNKLAIESTVRADIAENFMEGLYNLFAESYITVPEEKLDVVGELKAQLEELEAKLDESVNKQLELQSVIDEATMEATFDEVTEGLAATQVEKLRTLAEGIEFTDSDSYAKKLDILKGKYFSEKKEVNTGVISEEATEGLNEETKTVAVGEMANYVSAISRTKKF
jgi:hypothetical protein